MTCDANTIDVSHLLTEEEKLQVRGILAAGCDRQTAVDYLGRTLADLHGSMRHDAAFAQEVRRAEAMVELAHMRIVQDCAKEEKNWRASVWWLERHSPERFGGRPSGAMTSRQLRAFVSMLVDIFREELRDTSERRRLIERFNDIIKHLEQTLCEMHVPRAAPYLVEDGAVLELLDGDANGAAEVGETAFGGETR